MANLNGLGVFGGLTAKQWNDIITLAAHEDYDFLKDGELSETEFNRLLYDLQIDTVKFSTVNKNGDEKVDKNEMDIIEQQVLIQEYLVSLQDRIKTDFAKYPSAKDAFIKSLKEYAETFITNYVKASQNPDTNGNVKIENLAQRFKDSVEADNGKYQELMNKAIESSAEWKAEQTQILKGELLDEILKDIIDYLKMPDENEKALVKELGAKLEKIANNFIQLYSGNDLENDLRNYLVSYLTKTDADTMEEASTEFLGVYDTLGTYHDENDLQTLKDAAEEFLKAAIEAGIYLRLNGVTVKDETSLKKALKGYKDTEELNNDIKALIDSLSKVSVQQAAIDKQNEAIKAAEQARIDNKEVEVSEKEGSDFELVIDDETFDYSQIPGYLEGEKIEYSYYNAFGTDEYEALRKAKAKAREIVEGMKEQVKQMFKAQVEAMGIDFSKVEGLFNNAYLEALNGTLETPGNKSNAIFKDIQDAGWFKNSKATLNVKNLVDTFLSKFNTLISEYVNKMNEIDTDMDIQDIDYTVVYTDEDGNINEEMKNDLEEGTGDYTSDVLETISTRLQPQLRAKAEAMCKANGIEFNEMVFKNCIGKAKAAVEEGTIDIIVSKFAKEFKAEYTNWVLAEVDKKQKDE